MTEKSHAEMERFHYQALKNPEYQLEGMFDVLREELMMNLPSYQQPEMENIPEVHYIPIEPEIHESELNKRVKRLEGELAYLLKKNKILDERQNKRLPKKGRYLNE